VSNTILTADTVARVAAKLVGDDVNLGALVNRDLGAEWTKGNGSTVRVRVPGAVPSRTRGIYDLSTPVNVDQIAEQSIAVTLEDNVHSVVALSAGDLTLDVTDYAAQVLVPQTRSIVRDAERRIAAAMQATPLATSIAYDSSNPAKAFTAARRMLRANGVSADVPLIAAVGADVFADLLDGPAGTFDQDGKVRGFDVTESTRLSGSEAVFFVRDAFALVVRAPEAPEGVAWSASVADHGFALLAARDYDSTTLSDRSILQAFVGAAPIPLARDREDGTVELVEHGGAVRIDVA
jgi:hypothetical protein